MASGSNCFWGCSGYLLMAGADLGGRSRRGLELVIAAVNSCATQTLREDALIVPLRVLEG